MNNIVVCENRLKNIIVADKQENPIKIKKVVRAEIIQVLRNYFDVSMDDVDFDIVITDDGFYNIIIDVVSRNMKFANSFD
jgi:septum formation topological specificity factor MinE